MRLPAITRHRVTDPAPGSGPGIGVADHGMTRRRPDQDGWFIPLPVSLLFHLAVILLLLYAVHRQKLIAPSPQSSIAVVFRNTGLPHSAAHNAAPKAVVKAPPSMTTLLPPPPPEAAPPTAQTEVNLSSPNPVPFTLPKEIVPARPPKHAAVAHHAPPAPRQHFMVLNGMSFGKHPTTILNHAPGALNLAPPQSDDARNAPAITFRGNAGPDWESAFNRWVNEHKYYPQSAADQGESGSVTVGFTVLPNGKVIDLHLIKRSGAPLLDMAWYGLFRGVKVPPFPPGSTAKREEVIATIHYILIH
ncbi:energy transducer TonB [Acidiphilium sp. PA]|uniref:energy transducer TonB n=1 Tax=Acidiphilium sp. PA TaxID=2871705 RepID=UPI0022446956|nr:energy transducer TonB [Acidiphilium sp. PA]MCW8306162.1 energy transducer TonB [Acidiphilium sp. PA]